MQNNDIKPIPAGSYLFTAEVFDLIMYSSSLLYKETNTIVLDEAIDGKELIERIEEMLDINQREENQTTTYAVLSMFQKLG